MFVFGVYKGTYWNFNCVFFRYDDQCLRDVYSLPIFRFLGATRLGCFATAKERVARGGASLLLRFLVRGHVFQA